MTRIVEVASNDQNDDQKSLAPTNPAEHYSQLKRQAGIGDATAYRTVCATDKWWNEQRAELRDLCKSVAFSSLKSLQVADKISLASTRANENRQRVRHASTSTDSRLINPWKIICLVPRYNLADADVLAQELKIGLDSPDRMAEVLYYSLTECLDGWNIQGDTYVPASDVEKRFWQEVGKVGNPPATAYDTALAELVESNRIVLTTLPVWGEPTLTMSTAEYADADELICRRSAGMDKFCTEFKAGPPPGSLGTAQAQAFRSVFGHALTLVNAPPGYGKTHVIAAITKECIASDIPVAIGTFMGRAATRVAKELQTIGVDKEKVYRGPGTLHSILRISEDNVIGLSCNRPGIFIIDEASMISTKLLASVFQGIPDTWNVVLVGDINQLPPIEAGDPFGDLIRSGKVPVIVLDKNYRTDKADIQKALASIRDMKMPESSDDFSIETVNREDTIDTVRATLRKMSEDIGCDPREILITTPQASTTRKLPMVKVGDLNKSLKRILNPSGWRSSQPQWWLPADGDRVYASEPRSKGMSANAAHNKRAYNGELGSIVKMDKRTNTVLVEWDNRPGEYARYTMDEAIGDERMLDIAYVTTVHKVQGAEASGVIFVADGNCARTCLTNAHAYTACSRGKQKVAVITSRVATNPRTGFSTSVGSETKIRNTLLSHYLNGETA
jgi:hypothetical protein